MMNLQILDVIIPAYKARFLARTLEGFAGQSDHRFSLYVFDDASPEDLVGVIEPYRERLNINYHRFAENMGRRHLALHWNRCVAQTRAPWVWLFSDDDLVDPGCVAAFHRLLESDVDADVLRFDVALIDEHDQCLRKLPPQPARETSSEYLLQRFRRVRWSFVPEHIFRRSAFIREGGFIDFPLAWHTDDASWAAFGRQTGFAAIEGGCVRWRLSPQNISGCGGAGISRQKADATFQFYAWVERFLADASDSVVRKARMALPRYLYCQLFISGAPAHVEHLSWLAGQYMIARRTGVFRTWLLMSGLLAARSSFDMWVWLRALFTQRKDRRTRLIP